MIELDEDALVCDFAETYNIYDYRSLPLTLVATLSVGLRESSRIKMKMCGVTAPHDTVILGAIADRIGDLICGLSNGEAKYPPIAETFFVDKVNGSSQFEAFESAEDFETRLEIIRGRLNG